MSCFTDFSAFARVTGTYKKYRLEAPLVWEIGNKGSGWALSVPAGTVFDISVPRILEWALDPHERKVLPAAAIHDELLARKFDAAFAASEFRRAIIARKYPLWRAWIVFAATLIWTATRRARRRNHGEG